MKRSHLIFMAILLTVLGARAQVISGSFQHDGYTRVYDVYLPPSWFWSGSLPLVIDLHYLGADGRDQDSLSRFAPVSDADAGGFVLCHPFGQGTDWNVGQYSPYTAGFDDVGFIDRLIDTLQARYDIDLDRVYVVGMGQGGFMVHRLACELSHRIAAGAAVGASIADSAAFYCTGSRPFPIMIVHGTADSVIEYNNGLAGVWSDIPSLLDFWTTRNGCVGGHVLDSLPDLVQEGSRIYTLRWACGAGCEVLHYEVRGGGFSWPGADRDLGSGGVRNMDINASQHIWDFLRRWGLGGLADAPAGTSADAGFDIFPNPALDRIQVMVDENVGKSIIVRDLSGKVHDVEAEWVDARHAEVGLRGLPSGMYLVQVGKHVRRVVVAR